MDIHKQAQGLIASLGSPKVSLGLLVAFALTGAFASFIGNAGASVGTNGQGSLGWVQLSPASHALLLWGLVAGFSLSTLAGAAAGRSGWFARRGRGARLGVLASLLGLLLVSIGYAIGQGLGFRGQVLLPRSGTTRAATLDDGAGVALPFSLAYRPAVNREGGELLVRESADGPAVAIPFRGGHTIPLQAGLRLYPAGEMNRGAGGTLRILDRSGRVLVDGLGVKEGGSVPIPGTGAEIQVTNLWEDWYKLGPTARLISRDPARGAEVFLVHRALPGWDRGRGGQRIFELTDFTPGTEYLRFVAVKDPGLPLAATGGFLLFVGSLAGVTGWRRQPAPLGGTRPLRARLRAGQKVLFPPRSRISWSHAKTAAGLAAMTREGSEGGERCMPA